MANVIKQLGVQKGDRVGIYMPMIPEAAIAMLACARIGAVHSVVFGGFSAEALRDRLNDGQAKLVITADGGFRKDAAVGLKEQVDKALANNVTPSVTNVIVVQRTKQQVTWNPGAIFGGTTCKKTPPPTAPPNRWTAKICCSYSTLREVPANRKESSTPQVATTFTPT
jgi:Acyl-coenzyme A synthetases/AMP-(fatty) acid ligases